MSILSIRRLLPIAMLISAVFLEQLLSGSFVQVTAQANPTPTTAPTPTPKPQSVSWRLPIAGSFYISNGPGEGLHTGTSIDAIDYAPSPAQSVQVYAPMDGTVIDYLTGWNSGFGNVLRILHPNTNSCSFFAHLDSAAVSAGAVVTQGQPVAWTGNSGNGAGYHLHFEARSGCTVGDVLSGSTISVRPIMGNWWNQWYAPPEPNATLVHDPAQFSGGAQYPETNNAPALIAANNPRHLAGQSAPPNFASLYLSNITSSQVAIHFGASPDAPNLATDAHFRVVEYEDTAWFQLGALPLIGPTYVRSLPPTNYCLPTRQFCYAVETKLTSTPNWNFQKLRYNDVRLGEGNVYLQASYNEYESDVMLQFLAPNIPPYTSTYYLYEWHGGQVFVRSLGTTSQVTVNRLLQANATNAYLVSVLFGPGSSASTGWLYLHNFNANLFPNRIYLPLILKN